MFAVINLYSQLVDAANFIEIIVPTEYDNKSSQIPMAKRLFSSKTKRIFMNIKWGLFLYTLYMELWKSHLYKTYQITTLLIDFRSINTSSLWKFKSFYNPEICMELETIL